MSTTETELRNWTGGSTQAERLAAAILNLEGYGDIDPQAPLGGPDGSKDILCSKGGLSWVGAVYFPPTEQSFPDVEKKFLHDLQGPVRHKRDGIVFLTNQRLTLGEREALEKHALKERKECSIYHVERIRHVLDNPDGYGVRIEYLRIPMSEEEQLAFFARSGNKLEAALERNTAQLNRLSRQVEQLRSGQDYANRTIHEFAAGAGGSKGTVSAPPHLDPLSLENFRAQGGIPPLTGNLSIAMFAAFHRLVCFDLPARMIGHFRIEAVYIKRLAPDAGKNKLPQPPAPERVQSSLEELCDRWNSGYSTVAGSDEATRLEAIAKFHRDFLMIHPFLDGNGRAGRAVLMQQCLDLFGRADMSLLDRGAEYYRALEAADAGDLTQLIGIVRPVVIG
jgi:fido (protein-threonine AMPylation protein)